MAKRKYPTEHDKIQYMALRWLENLQYRCSLETKIMIDGKSYRVDVYGEKDNDKIIIECGYSVPKKLKRLQKFATRLYVWPLDSTEPIVWNDGIEICPSCGRIKNSVTCKEFNIGKFLKLKIPKEARIAGGYLSYNDIPKGVIIKKVRAEEIIQMRQSGLTYKEIGSAFGISAERVRQILPREMHGRTKPRKYYNHLIVMGEDLTNNQAIRVTNITLTESQHIRAEWRSHFKDRARSKNIKENNTYTVYLWLKDIK